MASGPLKIKKGTCPALILATWRHTTESVGQTFIPQRMETAFDVIEYGNDYIFFESVGPITL